MVAIGSVSCPVIILSSLPLFVVGSFVDERLTFAATLVDRPGPLIDAAHAEAIEARLTNQQRLKQQRRCRSSAILQIGRSCSRAPSGFVP